MRQESVRKHEEFCFCTDQVKFLAFVATVIKCTAGVEWKSEKIDIIIDAARRFLGVVRASGLGVQQHFREAFRLPETPGEYKPYSRV